MANATKPAGALVFSPEASPLAVPTAEAWRAMTPAEHLAFHVKINAALSVPAELMSEGRPHQKAKSRAIDALGLHFRTIGRIVYLAEEMAVEYPGEQAFCPDILAVLDVEQPEDDERMAWAVVDEGKGPDFVLEVLHRGDRDKDLVENVERYAHLLIPEYFVYDRARQHIHGWHLVPGASRYERKVPQLGHYRSSVLGLDLAVIGDNLRFLVGEAPLPVSADLIGRLRGIQENLEAKAEQAEAKAEQALAGLREALLTILDVRGIPCPDQARARVETCAEPSTLRQWLVRAKTAAGVEEVFAAAPPLGP
jgi:Uma2 family endonuclease